MAIISPFEVLQALDVNFKTNACGLPVNKSVNDDWVGIGFQINNVPLLARMDDVSEILPPPPMIRIPGVKFWVKGLANVRGSLMPVLDMKAFLYGQTTVIGKNSRILIVDKKDLIAGLLVEEVYGVRRFKPDEHKDEKDPDMESLQQYLAGVFVDHVHQWNVFSIDKLVGTEQFSCLV
jgi:twitching motility protein PilI